MSTASFEIRGWHVLTAILLFFGAIIAVNVTFAVYAVRSFPGEDVRRSYLQGLRYNDTLAERRAQAALGWQAGAELRSDAEGAVLEVVLGAGDAAPIDGAALTGGLEWPTSAQFDRALTFEPQGNGRYVARLGTLTPGRWRLRARAERGDGALDFESEITWRP
ncbi:MAG: ferredoxin [Alphaproteobacteria bacterium]|nr:MAG: ferredoxin [Alphaproteobacteria bacterium]